MARPNTIPTDAVALERIVNDPQRVEEIARAGQLSDLIRNYQLVVNANDPDIQRQVREQAQQQVIAMVREAGVVTGPDMRPGRAARDRRAPGTALNGIVADIGEFAQAIHHDRRTPDRDETLASIRNAMGSSVPADGGFTIPEEFRGDLMDAALETSVVRPRARVIPMSSPRVQLPIVDAPSRASSVFGGFRSYWTAEAATLVDSSPKFGRITLDAHKLTTFTDVPNELLDDGLALQAFLEEALPATVAWGEDLAFISGNGVGQPLGFLHTGNSAMVTVLKESGQAAGTIVWENLVKMWARMLPASLQRAVWVAHISTFPELATMALSVGTGGSAVWIGGPVGQSGTDAPPVTILGRPVVFTEKVPEVGDAGDITLVDFGYYLVGDRMSMDLQSSEHYRFQSDMTSYRCITRVDGRPGLLSPVTPAVGTDTLSAFVRLEARP
ncbi:phage major capsid protein [Actinomycetes bacterium KLBMP 9759]